MYQKYFCIRGHVTECYQSKYTKVFEVVKHNDMDEQLKFLIPTVNISIKMLKNDHLPILNKLLKAGTVKEVTLLSQNIKKNTESVRIIDGYHPDEVLAKLEKNSNNMMYMLTF